MTDINVLLDYFPERPKDMQQRMFWNRTQNAIRNLRDEIHIEPIQTLEERILACPKDRGFGFDPKAMFLIKEAVIGWLNRESALPWFEFAL